MFTMRLQHNACEIEHEVTTPTYKLTSELRTRGQILQFQQSPECIGQRAVKNSRPNKTIKLQHEDPLLGMWTNPGLNYNFINIFATGYTKTFRKNTLRTQQPKSEKETPHIPHATWDCNIMLVKLHLKSQLSTTHNSQLTNEFNTKGQIPAFQHTPQRLQVHPQPWNQVSTTQLTWTVHMHLRWKLSLTNVTTKLMNSEHHLSTIEIVPLALSLSRLRGKEMPNKHPEGTISSSLDTSNANTQFLLVVLSCCFVFVFVFVLFWLRCWVPWEMCGDGGRRKPCRNVNVRVGFAGSRGGIALLRRPPP